MVYVLCIGQWLVMHYMYINVKLLLSLKLFRIVWKGKHFVRKVFIYLRICKRGLLVFSGDNYLA